MRRFAVLSLLLGLAAAGALARWAGAEDAAPRREPSLAALEKRLDQVLTNQELLLQRFEAMMEELRVVKIRCTQ